MFCIYVYSTNYPPSPPHALNKLLIKKGFKANFNFLSQKKPFSDFEFEELPPEDNKAEHNESEGDQVSEQETETEPLLTSVPLAELQDILPDYEEEEAPEEQKNLEATNMAATSATEAAATENAVSKRSSTEESIFSTIYTVVKKVAIVGSIYLVGYMGWSVAWLIAPVIMSVAKDRFRKTTEHKRSIAKASALASEKEVILARIDELPAWVRRSDHSMQYS